MPVAGLIEDICMLPKNALHSACHRLLWCLAFVLLSGCLSPWPDFVKPHVSVTGVRLLPALEGELAPRIGVNLRISNPNPDDLQIVGASYSLALQGHDLLNGVSATVPTLKAYSDTPVELQLSTDIIALMRLAHSLRQSNLSEPVSYRFSAKLDTGRFLPSIRLSESGKVNISAPKAQP
jgi:LEA14-like dessication related protein